ncbi:hypothetical protein CHELA40_10623 [Chelatococcus asaccharovorans]|nr:hypothetical protein CHELA40_10623 [Chelatococcus asaccharovorans]CAH1686395.1 hypothetical protein CHELA17_64985 [Chelatococcus asaccharovorans]
MRPVITKEYLTLDRDPDNSV